MSTPRRTGPERELEHNAQDMEERLHRLEDHIHDAERTAHEQLETATPLGGGVVGDWHDTEAGPGQGQDPEGTAEDEARGR